MIVNYMGEAIYDACYFTLRKKLDAKIVSYHHTASCSH
jgi:hypothetical protein